MGGWGWVLPAGLLVGCGRTGLFGDHLFASASGGASESGEFDEESNDGPREPDDDEPPDDEPPDDEPPDDEPTLDVASELPPATCGVLPPVPAGPGCELPDETRQLLSEPGVQGILTVVDDSVYAVINNLDVSRVMRIDKCSDDVESLASEGVNPGNVIVVDEHVIWTDYVSGGGVWQMPTGGGEPVALAVAEHPLALALFDPWIVYSSFEGVFRIPRAGGEVEPVVVSEFRFFVSLASDGAVLWGNTSAAQAISWIDPLDGSYGEIAVSTYSGDVLADCTWVFWSDQFGYLHRIDRATGDDIDLGLRVYRFVHDETHVFASTGDSQVIAVEKASGDSRVVADLPGELPWRIAIDETHVYWSSAESGGVWSAPNPWL